MLYLSGCINLNLPDEVGFMHTPMMGNSLYHGRTWAADTGCFAAPHKHDNAKYLSWLERHDDISEQCLFATAPDVVGDAAATLLRSMPMLRAVRDIGYRAALVAQNGMEELTIPWEEFDALFIGGTTQWKLGNHAAAIVQEAKRRGKWVHMGRVNSLKRLKFARTMGCDSADGTHVAYSPDINIPKVQRWLQSLACQSMLEGLVE